MRTSPPLILLLTLPAMCLAATKDTGQVAAREPSTSWTAQDYSFYEPAVEQHYIHRETEDSMYRFVHMVSLEHFDGRFHAVWIPHHGSNMLKFHAVKGSPPPFQRLLWQTSSDARKWESPIRISETSTETPLDTEAEPLTHWQPNLLNYQDRELWCVWSIGAGSFFDIPEKLQARLEHAKSVAGTYLSILGRGPNAKWVHRRIFGQVRVAAPGTRHKEVGGYVFPSQNPVLLPSGRVVQPVTVLEGGAENLGSLRSPAYFSAAIYTDDDGKTWQISNLVSSVDNPGAHWEPHIMAQADGKLRMFIRDSGRKGIHEGRELPYRQTLRHPLFLTTTGTGTAKGQPIVFDPDVRRVWMETDESRIHQVLLPGGRYCMFQHDVWNATNFGPRSNLALFFSRTGEDDYVAGPGFVGRSTFACYPQGIVHDNKLYVAYTRANTGMRTGGSATDIEEQGIALSIVGPLPETSRRYVWPRDKDYYSSANPEWRKVSTEAVYRRPFLSRKDGRDCIAFQDRGTAGVEIDRVDFERGERLGVSFEVRIEQQQTHGNLILCSFGGEVPIRIGMPGNRPDQLYAYGRHQWEKIGALVPHVWTRVTIEFGANEFTVSIGDGTPVKCVNPIRYPERRLYLGDGYEIEPFESNRGSEFLINLRSLKTWSRKTGSTQLK